MSQASIEDIHRTVEGRTVATGFLATVAAYGDRVALRERRDDGTWTEWTWRDYADHVAGAASMLQSLGVEPGDRVVLLLRNVPSFHMIDLGVVFCGATPISIFNSSSPDQISYLTNHCGAKVAIVENTGFLERVNKVREELPTVQHVINVDEQAADLFHSGAADLEKGAALVTPDMLATCIYTSGTTGPPKGVKISHSNVAYTAESLRLCMGLSDLVGKRIVSYLPMAHIAERMTSHYDHLLFGAEVSTCPEAGKIALYLREVRPHIAFGVPRVWEKLHAGVMAALAADPEQAKMFEAGVGAASPIAKARAWGESTPEQDSTWDTLQASGFRQVREMIGLDEVELAISGAAPIAADLLDWFNAVGVPLSEIYGMSESSGPMTWAPFRIKPGSVGPGIPGCEVKLAEDGEIVCRGGNVFGGYLNDEEKTAEALDEDGWLHSGDIGEVDDDGYFRIVDRKKELIITAGGKNISPANLEAALKGVPLIGQACAIGDQRPFVSALVVLDSEVAPVWARQHGIEFTSLADLAADETVRAEVERGVAEAMAPFNHVEQVKKVAILADEWLADSEELTPTSKLKRRGIHVKYADAIEALYS